MVTHGTCPHEGGLSLVQSQNNEGQHELRGGSPQPSGPGCFHPESLPYLCPQCSGRSWYRQAPGPEVRYVPSTHIPQAKTQPEATPDPRRLGNAKSLHGQDADAAVGWTTSQSLTHSVSATTHLAACSRSWSWSSDLMKKGFICLFSCNKESGSRRFRARKKKKYLLPSFSVVLEAWHTCVPGARC